MYGTAHTWQVDISEVCYARSGDVNIAYQIVGEGPYDVVYVPGFMSNVELAWQHPQQAPFFRAFSSFCRLIRLDKRGTGMSDRVAGAPNLETRMDDVRAVMDAAGVERAALFGSSEGGPLAIVFAATYPERAAALTLYGTFARTSWAPDYPWGRTDDDYETFFAGVVRGWGREGAVIEAFRGAGEDRIADDSALVRAVAMYERQSASPGTVLALARMNAQIDVRPVLPTVRAPTLVLHRTGDWIDIGGARYLAEQIPGARFVELLGESHPPWTGDFHAILREVESFLTPLWEEGWPDIESERMLATVLFSDVVGSTAKAAELGDARWREFVQEHHRRVRQQLARFRGNEIDTAGDGFFATFDGPARAIRCACAIRAAVRELGIEIRVGLHTGECERVDGKIGGIAVHIGARVAASAQPGEVLVSSTVKDLVAGSGLEFEDRGAAELKGVPGEWRLYAVRT
jgi:class 3 adenylate cyclase/pimeloyl-ACP methyl ester carboxylesterase